MSTANADTVLGLVNTASGGVNWSIHSASGSSPYAQSSGDFLIRNASSNVLRLGNNGNATFAQGVSSGGNLIVNNGNQLILNNSINTAAGSIVCPGGGSLALRSYGQNMIYLNENAEIKFNTIFCRKNAYRQFWKRRNCLVISI